VSDEERTREEVADAASSDDGSADVEQDLDALLADVKRERDEYLDLAQRAKADFENYRKRTAREAADAERRGKLALARELVPAIDSLERALAAAEQDSDVGRGLELVHGELIAILGRAGVEAYDPVGERFDPALSEAVSTRAGADEAKPGIVVETLDRGYRSDGTVLRPARVIVSE
jgi:molecular chaperone GrpE